MLDFRRKKFLLRMFFSVNGALINYRPLFVIITAREIPTCINKSSNPPSWLESLYPNAVRLLIMNEGRGQTKSLSTRFGHTFLFKVHEGKTRACKETLNSFYAAGGYMQFFTIGNFPPSHFSMPVADRNLKLVSMFPNIHQHYFLGP